MIEEIRLRPMSSTNGDQREVLAGIRNNYVWPLVQRGMIR